MLTQAGADAKGEVAAGADLRHLGWHRAWRARDSPCAWEEHGVSVRRRRLDTKTPRQCVTMHSTQPNSPTARMAAFVQGPQAWLTVVRRGIVEPRGIDGQGDVLRRCRGRSVNWNRRAHSRSFVRVCVCFCVHKEVCLLHRPNPHTRPTAKKARLFQPPTLGYGPRMTPPGGRPPMPPGGMSTCAVTAGRAGTRGSWMRESFSGASGTAAADMHVTQPGTQHNRGRTCQDCCCGRIQAVLVRHHQAHCAAGCLGRRARPRRQGIARGFLESEARWSALRKVYREAPHVASAVCHHCARTATHLMLPLGGGRTSWPGPTCKEGVRPVLLTGGPVGHVTVHCESEGKVRPRVSVMQVGEGRCATHLPCSMCACMAHPTAHPPRRAHADLC